jgi:hopene-associated glycosyltransferase HpnB
MILLLSLLALAIWLYLIGFRGGFWRSGPVLDEGEPSGKAPVAVVVPARNEAESIRTSLTSLLAQNYPGPLSILLVDDNSTDATGEIAASLSTGARLTVLKGQPLPAGWSGKLWAIHQGLAHENAKTAGYILLTDADIEHAPGHISALVAKAEAGGLDLVSEMVHLHCSTAAERALIPAFVFFFQMLYPFAWTADPARRTAGAAGGTMLISRPAIDRIDGVSRIRAELIDDCALASQIKSTGGRIWLGHSNRAVSLRIYSEWRDIWNMIARTAYEQLRHSLLMLAGCVLGMALVYCAPPLLALAAQGLPRLLGALAWLGMALVFQPTLKRYRRSPLWGAVLPLVALFYLCATVASAVRHYAGRGGGWKDRVYNQTPHP